MTLSVLMITKNCADVVGEALESVKGLWSELLVDDEGSTDGTREILRRFGATIVASGKNGFGERKQNLVEKAKGDWILVLDADERVSSELIYEIRRITNHHKIMHVHKNVIEKNGSPVVAYRIPYQNYVFGRPVYYGGEKYAKVRLFRRGRARISPEAVHEEVVMKKGAVGELKGKIHHHSYRTPTQLFRKFTSYAWIAARQKSKAGERATFQKLFLYGPHMFWVRFINDRGYRDGWRGLVLALAFAYMETLTYWILLWRK
jgi:glycosyltransferase involved in cell wall biosynthesis